MTDSICNYSDYCRFLTQTDFDNFKSNYTYNTVLEHVSKSEGDDYLNSIETEFNLSFDDILGFVELNDKYGNPKKATIYSQKHGKSFDCSPSCLRYMYHSLLILDYYKQTGLDEIVEIGCGYGGLCLAINYFSKILQISIKKYHLIDLPEACKLIHYYLQKNSDNIIIPCQIYHSNNYGSDIDTNNLFLVSNYCFTEIDNNYKQMYCDKLIIPKTKHGFFVWQSTFYSLNNLVKLNKEITKLVSEYPTIDGNHYVYY
jgi:hypothetical protein